ncbi:hypothetical protein KCMC57_up31560 [Kitasatospora sp. CMC57]|uniref:Zinc-finger domain-containing protein n=1 Tax=Kitasatospora sp. CMC57 TaxID=3231513 RepID=A0AB33JZ99_9ACTN
MTPSWTEPDHPDVELLADLAEDLTAPAEVPLLRAHLDGCAECADTYAALAEVRELLGAVEDFPALPAELGDRIDAALAVEAAAPVTPAADPDAPLTRGPAGPTRRLRRRGRVLLAAVACLAVLGLGSTLLAQQRDTSGADSTVAGVASRQQDASAGPQVFTEADLTGQIRQLVQDKAARPDVRGTAGSALKAPSLGAGAAPEFGPESASAAPCPATAPGVPLLAAPGRFGAEPVTALVYPLTADQVEVYLVTADCRVRLHRTVPAG